MPDKLIIDCSIGKITTTPVTSDDLAIQTSVQQVVVAQQAQDAKNDTILNKLATVANVPIDDLKMALGRGVTAQQKLPRPGLGQGN